MKKRLPSPKFFIRHATLLMCGLFCLCTQLYGQIQLVKDINTTKTSTGFDYYNLFTDVDGTMYFVLNGVELWKSDGTPTGTAALKSFSSISVLFNISGSLFFVADDGVSGNELWKSNGTAEGTSLVKDIRNGQSGSNPGWITDVNGIAYFVADDGTTGRELWRSDGTEDGTTRVKDIMRVKGSSNPGKLISYNGRLYFVANDARNGYELWVSDGSEQGTVMVKDILQGKRSGSPDYLTVSNGMLYFSAAGSEGDELWKSNGTAIGTVMVKDIRPGSVGAFPSHLTDVKGTLFFRASDGTHGQELWKTDGTPEGTVLVKDILKGRSGGLSTVSLTTSANGKLYFYTGGANSSFAIHESDGTASGTKVIVNDGSIYDGTLFATINNVLYFTKTPRDNNDENIRELWRIDNAGPQYITDIGKVNDAPVLSSTGNKLYIVVWSDENNALWVSDGTAEGMVQLRTTGENNLGSFPRHLNSVGDNLVFTAQSGDSTGIWVSDGTEQNTKWAGTIGDNIHSVKSSNTVLILDTWWEVIGWDLLPWTDVWKSDGTEEGTGLSTSLRGIDIASEMIDIDGTIYFIGNYNHLYALDAGSTSIRHIERIGDNEEEDCGCRDLTNVNGSLYFIADEINTGSELWKDGHLVKDINPGPDNAIWSGIEPVGTTLYFIADDGVHGEALWKSDGTEEGTVMVRDIEITGTSLNLYILAGLNDTLYFIVSDFQSGRQSLWRSDGSYDGTVHVADITERAGQVFMLSALNDELLFVVRDNTSGVLTLWKSDGTQEGTMSVAELGNNSGFFFPNPNAVMNGKLYFDIDGQVWVTDGTSCGTFRLQNQADPNGFVQSVGEMVAAGSTLFLTGAVMKTGDELFKVEASQLPENPCNEVAKESSDQRSASFDPLAESVSNYPNPFTKSFTLNIHQEEGVTYEVSITDSNGAPIDVQHNLKSNVDYNIGASLPMGIYHLKIGIGGRSITKRIVKVGN